MEAFPKSLAARTVEKEHKDNGYKTEPKSKANIPCIKNKRNQNSIVKES